MPVAAICRLQEDKKVNFNISYLKTSVWLKKNNDARIVIHCVVRSREGSSPFSALRIIVPHKVSELCNMTYLLLDPDHMMHYEDEYDKPIVDTENKSVTGNGGIYFPTDVTFDVKEIMDGETILTEIVVNFKQSVTVQSPRGFRIEYKTPNYIKERTRGVFSFHESVCQAPNIKALMMRSEYKEDIVEVEYGDIWIVTPEDRTCTMLTPSPKEIEEFSVRPKAGYKEYKLEKNLKKMVAFRWRYKGPCPPKLGPTIYGELKKTIPDWVTWTALIIGLIALLLTFIAIMLDFI